MSGEEDLYLNQSEAEALFFSDALLGNADELDFESFGDASGLDVSFFFRHMLCFLVSPVFRPNCVCSRCCPRGVGFSSVSPFRYSAECGNNE